MQQVRQGFGAIGKKIALTIKTANRLVQPNALKRQNLSVKPESPPYGGFLFLQYKLLNF